ncbi:unnamed protein product, partial [marine sediment metagenome]
EEIIKMKTEKNNKTTGMHPILIGCGVVGAFGKHI